VVLVKLLAPLVPKSMEGQMVALLALSLLALFAALMIIEMLEHEGAIETAESRYTLDRIRNLYPVLQRFDGPELADVVAIASSCHAGYSVTNEPFRLDRASIETERVRLHIARASGVDPAHLAVGHARLTREDFSYRECSPTEIDLPIEGIVISLKLASGKWLNAEVHPHEWHFREKMGWMLRASGAFIFVGSIAIFFMRRLSRPLNSLTTAARRFGEGLQVATLQETGSADLRRAIHAFNTMQEQVAGEIARRTNTLAAISHDVRTPLTALRVKAELVDDAYVREDLISSINRMERITASALEFLRGQSRGEPVRSVDLSALLESECLDFEDTGRNARFIGAHGIHYTCRPDALGRAVRNLIDNAIKYGHSARVQLRVGPECVEISVADAGPGIPADKVALALEPFERLSTARESNQGGFGLGLAVAKAVAEGHDGELILRANEPRGLQAILRLPLSGAPVRERPADSPSVTASNRA
jgi:signal transduction histidine kinase